jgi:hypothetical protein
VCILQKSTRALLALETTPCPRCNVPITKSEGCAHMVCSPLATPKLRQTERRRQKGRHKGRQKGRQKERTTDRQTETDREKTEE